MPNAVLNDILELEEWLEYIGGVVSYSGNTDLLAAFNASNVTQLTVGEFLSIIDAAEQAILSINWQDLVDQVAELLNTPIISEQLTAAEKQTILDSLSMIEPSDITEGFDLLRAEFAGISTGTLVVDAMNIAGQETPVGTDGNDVLAGTVGSDDVRLMNGDDAFAAGQGDIGDDTIRGGSGNDTINGGSGQDVLFGGSGEDLLRGGWGSDLMKGGRQADVLIGAQGHDTVYGEGGADRLDGGSGNDRLVGGSGHDTILGGAGIDRLFGGNGNDSLVGGAQADYFIFRGNFGDDTIRGFAALSDAEKIDLRGVSEISDLSDLRDNHLTQDGSNAIIADGLGNTITLLGVDINDLDAGDFIF
ncbi:Hemolysin-type calcium-binding protein repeat protein (2 copies) (plasmid) [Phaeobacter inhibens]|uniref:calcium-binding protein n=1 Tax=Phaeobacter inhibens TaxID=221822 RepID=UPI000C9AF759|nr:calcium-binding protein [Phaeobacter inhibens]AUQ72487.1 Hemolysin-type calcium-binding protein repeat protein (2 copies) [Phaeobacter inhibens]AUR05723.1 Hemolysin-type calcium-binding protein repeat protein (2 copies) [Phaeobacter inhibens]